MSVAVVLLLPLLGDPLVTVKQAEGVTAQVRAAVTDDVAKLLAPLAADAKTRCNDGDVACVATFGKQRGADLVALGKIARLDDGYRVTLTVIDVATRAELRRADGTLHGDDGDARRLELLVKKAFHPELAVDGTEERAPLVDTEQARVPRTGPLEDPAAPAERAIGTDVIVLGSVGAGLLVLGGVAGALSLRDALEVEQRAAAQNLAFPADQDLVARGNILALTADGLYVAGIAALGVGAALYFAGAP